MPTPVELDVGGQLVNYYPGGPPPDFPCVDCGWKPGPGGKWPSEGGRACWWIEQYCVCGEGDWYGKPIRLRDDQMRSLWRWYEFCGACGHWRYNHWVRTEATGGGKTTFMAAVMTLELAGPPEISCVSPVITSAANSWDQANRLFGAASIMCGGREGSKVKESPLRGYMEVYDSQIIRADGRPGEINRVAAVAGTNEGASRRCWSWTRSTRSATTRSTPGRRGTAASGCTS